MCGIFGHIGSNQSFERCIEGLKFLEYRGYDSAGIAGIEDGNLICYKEKGKISELERSLERKIHHFQSSIGHTRWATHGEANKNNAHPHLDQKKEVAVVHNGILENHRSLRLMLEERGVVFESDTDSEVIAQLISYFYEGDFVGAVRKATNLMKGFWGLAILHKKHPGQIVATRLENPIVIGISKKNNEAFVSSDPHAFREKDLDLYYLQNHQIALIDQNQVQVFNQNDEIIEVTPEYLDLPNVEISKQQFEHFMLKEIFEQPLAIKNALHNRILFEKGNVEFENFSISPEEFSSYKHIVILGCGTSWHAGCIAAEQIQAFSKVLTRAEIASEYRYKDIEVDEHTLVIAISQSGETFDTIASVRKVKAEGAKILAICNVANSTLTREAHHTILLRAGPEISVCSTKAFTSQLTVLSLLALYFGRLKKLDSTFGKTFLNEMATLPTIVETVLEQKPHIDQLGKELVTKQRFFFLGRQYMYPTCLEAALKLKEISYLDATGYPAGELKHGPIALIDHGAAIIALLGNQKTYEKMLGNLAEIKARGGYVAVFTFHNSPEVEELADHVVYLPSLSDSLATIPYAVATQMLAYSMAHILGTDIDQPRNLAKSVTVE